MSTVMVAYAMFVIAGSSVFDVGFKAIAVGFFATVVLLAAIGAIVIFKVSWEVSGVTATAVVVTFIVTVVVADFLLFWLALG